MDPANGVYNAVFFASRMPSIEGGGGARRGSVLDIDERLPHVLRRPGLDPGPIGINERHELADKNWTPALRFAPAGATKEGTISRN
jgi:hypothetical protein